MTYYYRFTNYEKMALCAFGCPNKEQTIDNLKIAALIAVQEETRTILPGKGGDPIKPKNRQKSFANQ